MAKQSPHKRYKGCCLICGIHLDAGQAERTPFSALKRIGRKRRLRRHELPDGY